MPRRRIEPVVAEIIEAIDGIEISTRNKSLADFKDWLLRMGVQRALEIISEASRHLPDELLLIAPEIPWKQIRGIGNILRHEYHRLADSIVWSVVTDHLPQLRIAMTKIRAKLDSTAE
ncbi:DUF86 domain-containing protein [Phyllobacterium sp. BT25]|uniref:DUF86 domain-containing protein n=1 Tax=Phyllobacterium pellucidum TaxID=2740464 RepID=A0A849VVG5_9HYPH|nr:HepT-like ribonuclease domain-containing protein [Phyllobacterium pellucidum]NTS31990.1 DUF86 domain-containing protein [Phyllobacterium pellucidum]